MPGWVAHVTPAGATDFWWVKTRDLYLGVAPNKDGTFSWFVGQGRKGDPDLEPEMLAGGKEPDDSNARYAATTWYNDHADELTERP